MPGGVAGWLVGWPGGSQTDELGARQSATTAGAWVACAAQRWGVCAIHSRSGDAVWMRVAGGGRQAAGRQRMGQPHVHPPHPDVSLLMGGLSLTCCSIRRTFVVQPVGA
jgi:hypothetical protein